jgi:protein-S-isoprenylcysteine O-methyltransferase Ste14
MQLTGYFLLLCFIIFIVTWIVTAFSTKRTVRRSGWWRGAIFVTFVVLFLVARVTRGTHFSPTSGLLWQRTLPLALFGDALSLAGLVIMLWARFTIGRNWSGDVVLKQDHELITRGPYRFVRHPIYSGGLLMMLGWAVWSGHIVNWMAFVLTLVVFGLKAAAEEKLLTEYFGNAYRDYKSRVKALIPYVI